MTALAQLTEQQVDKEVTTNDNFEAVSPAGLFGRKASTTSALTWGYYGGVMLVDGVLTTISDGAVLLTASNTNYIEATRAGVVSANITGFTAGRIPLYEAIAGAATITSYTDKRDLSCRPARSILSKSIAGGAGDTTLTAAEARVDILILTGALTGNRNVILPAVAWPLTVYNNTSGSYTVTVKTASGTGKEVTQGKRTQLHCDGTNVEYSVTDLAALGLGTADSPQFAGVNIGHASDTTLTRVSAGDIAVEGNTVYRASGTDVALADGGTGAGTARGAAANLEVPYVLAKSGVAVSAPADANENVLATITIPAGAMGPNGAGRLRATFTFTGSTNQKLFKVRLDGVSGSILVQNSTTTAANILLSIDTIIHNRNSASSQMASATAGGGIGFGNSAMLTAAVDTSAEKTLVITGQKATAGETLTLEGYHFELTYGA